MSSTRDWLCSVHSDIHVQHAVAFAEFWLHRANIPAFRGTWEARTSTHELHDSTSCPSDWSSSRTCKHALITSTIKAHVFCRHCVIHLSYCCCSFHALTRRIRCVTIPRHSYSRRGQTFSMPCFTMSYDSYDSVTVHYRVAGMLYHCGDTLHAGHYQTVLCTMRSAVSGPSGISFISRMTVVNLVSPSLRTLNTLKT